METVTVQIMLSRIVNILNRNMSIQDALGFKATWLEVATTAGYLAEVPVTTPRTMHNEGARMVTITRGRDGRISWSYL